MKIDPLVVEAYEKATRQPWKALKKRLKEIDEMGAGKG